jgi:hypothetical protein
VNGVYFSPPWIPSSSLLKFAANSWNSWRCALSNGRREE